MSDRQADLRAIEQLAMAWRSGWLTGDADALMALYVDGPILLPQGQPPVIGRDAIQSLYEGVFKEFDIKSETTLHEVDSCGDLGYFWSSYRLTAIQKGGGGDSVPAAGKSVFIVKRQDDGAWKIALLIDNSDSE